MTPEGNKPKKTIRTKAELAEYIDVGASTLRKLLNKKYYERLQKVGYNKNESILPPIVVREFIEIWGKNLTDDEI